MTGILTLAGFAFALITIVYVFVNSSAAAIANSLRTIGPIIVCGLGLLLIYVGRAGLGLPLLVMGGMWFARNRKTQLSGGYGGGQKSTVRSAWLEMQLDHETGDLEGLILTGDLEGTQLSELNGQQLLDLYADLSGDNESAALLEAYLDRRMPGWRDSTDTNADTGSGEPFSSGAMTKEEAYQVLGLSPGASVSDIRSAHRRLMKAVHPDSGGSTFLAARINQAKDTLLD